MQDDIYDNAVFTIVAYNYLGSALTLGKSIKDNDGNCDFIIFIADKKRNDIEVECDGRIIYAEDVGIEEYEEMAFKYDVTEFATSIKPFCIEYLFDKYDYSKVIYMDPDIYVYESLKGIYERLDVADALLTPHILNGTSAIVDIEVGLMHSGSFNLGFFGVKNSVNGKAIVRWWADKLKKYSYSHAKKGFYTDQKWMNIAIAEFEGIEVLRDYAYNVAWWNFNERVISSDSGKPYTKQDSEIKPVVFFHFSGYKPGKKESISKSSSYYGLENKADIEEIFEFYNKYLKASNYKKYSSISYGYLCYSNGMIISRLNRRLFGRLIEEGRYFENPFNATGELYLMFKKNGMLSNSKDYSETMITRKSMRSFFKYEKLMHTFFKMTKKILGVNRYELISRYLSNSMSEENQIFLLNIRN